MDKNDAPISMPPKRFPGDGLPPIETLPADRENKEPRVLSPEESREVDEILERALQRHSAKQPSKLDKLQEDAVVVAGGIGATVLGCFVSAAIAGTFLYMVLKVVAAWSKLLN